MRLASSRLPLRLLLLPSAKHPYDDALKPIEQAAAWVIDHALTQAKSSIKLKDCTKDLAPLPASTQWEHPDVTLVFDELAYTKRCSHVVTGYWACTSLSPTAAGTPVGQLEWHGLMYAASERRYVGQVVLPLRLFAPGHHYLEHLRPADTAFTLWVEQMATFFTLQALQDIDPLPGPLSLALYTDVEACILLAELEGMSRDVQLRRLDDAVTAKGLGASSLLLSQRARLLKSQRHFAQGAQAYQQALRAAPVLLPVALRCDWLIEQGACHALANQHELAMRAWQQAITLQPSALTPYLNLAMTLEEHGQLRQAIETATSAVSQTSPDPRLYHLLARLHSQHNQWDEALAYYQLQLIAEPDNPWVFSNLAVAYLQNDQLAMATLYLRHTAVLDPDGEAGNYAQLILGSLLAEPLSAR
jgi:tetratricopeptide (TPR) repeat protein